MTEPTPEREQPTSHFDTFVLRRPRKRYIAEVTAENIDELDRELDGMIIGTVTDHVGMIVSDEEHRSQKVLVLSRVDDVFNTAAPGDVIELVSDEGTPTVVRISGEDLSQWVLEENQGRRLPPM